MPILGKRKRNTRWTPRKRRRTLTRFPRRSLNGPLGKARKAFSFKRKTYIETITVNNLADFMKGYSFSLSQLNNATEYTNLFDQFRICGIAITLMPSVTDFSAASGVTMTNFAMPEVRSIIDKDDASNPTSFNEMYEYNNCKITRGHREHKRFWKPAILSASYETAVSSAYTPRFNQWLSTTDPATPHYGVKIGINALGSAAAGNMYYRMYATFYIQCKNPK